MFNQWKPPSPGDLYFIKDEIWLTKLPGDEYYKKRPKDIIVPKNNIILFVKILNDKRNFLKFLYKNKSLYIPNGDFHHFLFWKSIELIEERKIT